jgi:hypothetical protein
VRNFIIKRGLCEVTKPWVYGWADQSAEGARCDSLGQRPRKETRVIIQALKARDKARRRFISRFQRSVIHICFEPGALRQAITLRAFGTLITYSAVF